MEIIESVRDGPYFMKDGNEWISSVPDDYRFVVTVQGPDLTKVYYQALIIYLCFIIACRIIASVPYASTACGIAEAYAMYNLMCIVGTQGLYNYNFYAQPVGHVRQSFQAIADDEVFQGLIGKVIPVIIDDPLCFSQGQCQLVADFNCDILRFQRNRVKFGKITDLRDEEGDMIQVPHPYTNQPMKFFVTELTRRYQKPTSPDSNDGYFLDDNEGWRIL